MRLTSLARPLNPMPRFSSQPARTSAAASSRTVDAFISASPAAAPKAPNVAKEALAAVGTTALEATLSALVEKLAQALGRALNRFLSKFSPKAAALPAPAVTPQSPVTTPSQPTPAPAQGLAPTPLAKEVPGQTGYNNTIQDPHIAPKSSFRNAVNAAIDAVRAKAIGIDPQDPDAITDYDAYHSAVVQELRGRGYLAAYDGEELAIGRKGDDFSEQFDISTSTGRVRRFYASYLTPPVWA